MLNIRDLSITYPNGIKAIDNITLNIDKGMFGLLGPNGSGKSSLMRTIATLQEPDNGSIGFDNINVLTQKEQMRSVLGYLPQEFGVYPQVTAEDLLHYLAILKGMTNRKQRKEAVDNLLEITNLSQYRKKKLGNYSGGMKQRFGIAQALLGNPKILIVDEPTAGLDPGERDRFLNILNEIGENTLVILSTHIVSDVRQLCNDMAIIRQGRVLIHTPPLKAIEGLQGKVWATLLPKSENSSAHERFKVLSSQFLHGEILLKVFSETQPDPEFSLIQPDLEDVYFSLIKSYWVFNDVSVPALV
jgi:ABC-2 type transport system ATP-binding protein